MTEELRLAPSFLASAFMHLVALLLVSTLVTHQRIYLEQDFVSVRLLDVPPEEKPTQQREQWLTKRESATTNRLASPAPMTPTTKNEPTGSIDTKAPAQPTPERFPAMTKTEGGGSEAGAGNLSDQGDVGTIPGTGTGGGGGGTAPSGLGHGSGAPGLPAQQPVLRTNREAKPIQTARAVYPPMALRMGLEGDVTLKIEVDPEGKVTKAKIIKNVGAGFDEEALKAVRQSRFEPAQRDGQNVPGEFTFIYRFRLQR